VLLKESPWIFFFVVKQGLGRLEKQVLIAAVLLLNRVLVLSVLSGMPPSET